jgi:hypothetical protein
MSDFYQPFEKLIPIVVLGRRLEVPENNLLLRQLQYVCPEIGMGRYCWNGECRYCEISYQVERSGPVMGGLACLLKATPGLRVTRLAFELKYNLSRALRAAPPERD